MVRWVVVGFALFLFILLLIKIRVIVEVRVGVENSGLHIEVILLRRLLRREFTLENLKTGFDRGEAAVGWKQTEEAAQGRTLSKGWRRMVSPDIRLGIQQALMLRREIKKRRWLARIMRSVFNVKVVNWRTVVGLEDAMYTALAAGALWSFKGWMLALVSCLTRLHEQRIEVVPSFGGRMVESICHCEVLFRLVHLLVVVPAVAILFLQIASPRASQKVQESHTIP